MCEGVHPRDPAFDRFTVKIRECSSCWYLYLSESGQVRFANDTTDIDLNTALDYFCNIYVFYFQFYFQQPKRILLFY